MKKFWILALLAIVFLGACNSPESKLIGNWKVAGVQTDFGKIKLPPEIIAHIVAEQKKISFRIINDSVLVLMLDNNTHEAKWKMDKQHNISYYFTTQPRLVNKLGKWNGNEIITDTKMPLGKLVVTYEKK